MNKSYIRKIVSVLLSSIILFSFILPLVTIAKTDSPSNSKTSVDSSESSAGPRIRNPLGENTGTLSTFVAKILHILFEIGAILVVFFIILSGFNIVMAQGDETKLKKAKSMLFGTIIGAVILLGAETISLVISNTVKQLAQ